jgi:transmembrane sensor
MSQGLNNRGGDPDRADAADWVVRLHAPDAGEADWLAFDAWLSAAPANRAAFDTAAALWAEVDARAEDVTSALEDDTGTARTTRGWGGLRWSPAVMGGAVAAAAVVLLAPFAVGLMSTPSVAYATELGQRRTIQLADGSRVDLNSASSISVMIGHGRREVVMNDAEAAFDVAHDPAHPFIIHVGDQTVRVVGTQFDVSHRGGMISVTVRRGMVQVAQADGGAPVALAPGQQLQHRQGDDGSTLSQVAPDDAFAWRQGRLICRNEALSQVVADLNHYFRKPIRVADDQVGALKFSGVLTVDDESSTLSRLSSLLPLSATPSEGVIVLQSRDHPR